MGPDSFRTLRAARGTATATATANCNCAQRSHEEHEDLTEETTKILLCSVPASVYFVTPLCAVAVRSSEFKVRSCSCSSDLAVPHVIVPRHAHHRRWPGRPARGQPA